MLKLIKTSAFIIILTACLFTPAISGDFTLPFPALNNRLVFENGKKGVDVSISSWNNEWSSNWADSSIYLNNVNYYKIGAKINDVTDLKNINFYASLLDAYVVDCKTSKNPSIIKISCLDFKSSNQIETYVDWFKIGYGLGMFLGSTNDPSKHVFLYSGMGLTKALFNDTINNFKRLSFNGVKPYAGLQISYGGDNLIITSVNEIKAIVWDKTLYEINPKIELSYDVLSLTGRSSKLPCDMLLINFSAEYSRLLYKNIKNDSFIIGIGLSYTWGRRGAQVDCIPVYESEKK